jgi:hypothetical protein
MLRCKSGDDGGPKESRLSRSQRKSRSAEDPKGLNFTNVPQILLSGVGRKLADKKSTVPSLGTNTTFFCHALQVRLHWRVRPQLESWTTLES